MIITRTPFRISFCGGGSDLSSFYSEHGGCVISTTIDKYMYINIHPCFAENTTILKYSKTEIINDIKKIDHKIFNQVLNDFKLHNVEISVTADVPAGTGLGSSSSFTVGLLNLIYCYLGKYVSKSKLAELACEIEIEKLKNPIGKQDQYAAAFGGLNYYKFYKDGSVSVQPIIVNKDTYKKLQSNLLMFYTGEVRNASNILCEQNKNMSDCDKVNNLIQICKLTDAMKVELEKSNLSKFGEILYESWLLKRSLASGITSPEIDGYFDIAMSNGATGGKLLGAGGGGFLLFYCEQENQERLRKSLGLREMSFKFEQDGTSVIFDGNNYRD
ncbi:MAG: GHMP kinase [Burkholderiales bacterium]